MRDELRALALDAPRAEGQLHLTEGAFALTSWGVDYQEIQAAVRITPDHLILDRVTLKGGEFLRISVKRGGERYLIHLPVAR